MILFENDINTSFVYRYKEFLTKEECEIIVDYALKQKKEVATVGNNTLNTETRSNNVSWLNHQNSPTLTWLFGRVASIIEQVNQEVYKFNLYGITEDFQFTEYDKKNDHYNWHIDSGSPVTCRKLSAVIQLSDPKDYEGCNLEFAHESKEHSNLDNNKLQGLITIFPSFLAHRVTELLSGKRHSMVIWCGGNAFK